MSYLNRLAAVAAASLPLLGASALAQRAPDHLTDLIVKAPGRSADQLAALVKGSGLVAARDRRTSQFRLRPTGGHTVADLKALVARDRTISVVREDASDGHLDMTSVSSITAYIERMERAAEAREKRGEEDEDEHEEREASKGGAREEKEIGVDYLEAYNYRLKLRAFPNDTIDWSAYRRAGNRRNAMRAATPRKLRMTRDPQRWEWIGPHNLDIPYQTYYGVRPLTGRVNAVAIDPVNGNTMYVGGAEGGVWKSTDAGVNWIPLSNDWDFQPINCITIDPSNPNTIYVGMGDNQGGIGYGSGIMKSTDGGVTWTEIARATMGSDIGVTKIAVDPDFPNNIIATTGGAPRYWGRVYRSTDGGNTWTTVINQANSQWSGLTYGPKNASGVRRFYAAAQGYSNNKLFRSDDHGATWTPISTPTTTPSSSYLAGLDISASPIVADRLYLICGNEQRIARSDNAGATWTSITNGFPTGGGYNWSQGSYNYYIGASSMNTQWASIDAVYTGLIDVVFSPDSGQSWQSYGGPTYGNAITHNDQHCIGFDPSNPNRFLFGNDGGVWLGVLDSTTNKVSVKSLNKNLGLTMFYSAAFHPGDPTRMLGGTQDNATPVAAGDLNNWINTGAGDGTGTAINTANPDIQYNTWQGLGNDGGNFNIIRTRDGWNSSDTISFTSSGDGALFVPPLAVHPANPNLLMAGTQYLSIFDEGNQQWSVKVGNQRFGNGGGVHAIAGAPSDVNTIYVGTSDGFLYVSTNKGANWKQLSGFPVRSISSISVSPTDPKDIMIGLQGSGSAHLYRCSDTSVSNPTFFSLSGSGSTGLPDISLNAIARDMLDQANTIWVGTDIGVFLSRDGGATWSNATQPLGLPNVGVEALESVPGTGYLMAATYGRGMYRLKIADAQISSELDSIAFDVPSVRRGHQVNLTITLKGVAKAGGQPVTLTSSDEGRLYVPSTVVIPAGQTSRTIPLSTSSSYVAGTVTVTATTTNSVSTTLETLRATATGSVVFNDYVGTKPTSVTVYFRRPNETTPFSTVVVALNADGAFTIPNAPEESFDMYVQPLSYLRRTIRVNLATDDVTGLRFSLTNGDVNGDNQITASDQALLSAAYRATPTSSNWNPKADLNGDRQVTASDQAILSKNYRAKGDN